MPPQPRPSCDPPIASVAMAYNRAGDDYASYADGNQHHPFSFAGLHAYADKRVWSALAAKIDQFKAAGSESISILDAGCGPGTWLRRAVLYARRLGFREITARGFDVAAVQIDAARQSARGLVSLPGVHLTFDVADLTEILPEADASVDLTICLYSVLSHLPVAGLPKVAAEIARATRGSFITTVRPVGSRPTIFVGAVERAASYALDHDRDRCDVELRDGHRMTLSFHLFRKDELQRYFAPYFDLEDVLGLDIFHDRFKPDPRWNPRPNSFDARLSRHLAWLEEVHSRNPSFVEYANHLMLVGSRRVTTREHPGEINRMPRNAPQVFDAA
jgi:SAM-dependent methyltransferase